jgi:type VII secretion integral membrane protein EccD
VVSGNRHLDLALPSVLPLSEVLPQLLQYCSPDDEPERPAAWTLAKLGGSSIGLRHSLADAGILDGDVLELRSAEATPRPAYVEDVRDAIEDAVDESGGIWQRRTSRGFVLVAGALGLALAAIPPFARTPHRPELVAGGFLVAALCVLGGWWSTERTNPVAGQLAIATGCLWGGIAGWLTALSLGWSPLIAIGGGTLAAFVVALIARAVTLLAIPHVAALAMAAGAGVLTASAATIWPPLTPARLAGALAVLVIGVLPRVSVSVGGLATADYRVRKSALITQQDLADRVRESNALLFGGILGAALVGALAGAELTGSGSVWDRLFGLSVAAGLLLRSRVFSQIQHIAPLRAAGAIVLAAQLLRLTEVRELRPWFVTVTGAAVAVLVASSALSLSDITRARVKRLFNWTEVVVVVAMVALGAGAVGLYATVADMMK